MAARSFNVALVSLSIDSFALLGPSLFEAGVKNESATEDSCFIDVPAVVSSFYCIMLFDSSIVDSWLMGSSGAVSYSYSFFSSYSCFSS